MNAVADIRPPHKIRELREGDWGFVLKSWLRAARKAPEFRRMPADTFFHHFNAVGRAILQDPSVRTAAAQQVGGNFDGRLLSFIIVDPLPVLHFVYTIGAWRRHGFAEEVAKAVDFDWREPFGYTFPTKMASSLLRNRGGALYLGDAVLHRYS